MVHQDRFQQWKPRRAPRERLAVCQPEPAVRPGWRAGCRAPPKTAVFSGPWVYRRRRHRADPPEGPACAGDDL